MIELADTSVWATRHRLPGSLSDELTDRIVNGEIATCDAVRSELLYSARNHREFRQLRSELDALPDCPIEKPQWVRALDVYEQLAARGGSHHRRIAFQDLLIAAAAETAGIGLLHYDRDYELIARITGQPQRAVTKLGTL